MTDQRTQPDDQTGVADGQDEQILGLDDGPRDRTAADPSAKDDPSAGDRTADVGLDPGSLADNTGTEIWSGDDADRDTVAGSGPA